MEFITYNAAKIAVTDGSPVIESVQDFLDLLVSASYLERSDGIILRRESLPEKFFDLKTGFAGEVLQKFSNYGMKLAVVGDFSGYTSKSLKDFIYECNRGRLIFFKPDMESALAALSAVH